jgi:hypothetical protein
MRHPPKSGPNRNIRRVVFDNPNGTPKSRSWQVVFNMKGLPLITASIPWKRHGGEDEALVFARRLRNAFAEEFAASERVYGTRAVRGGFYDEGSGHGVYLHHKEDQRGVKKYPVWRASVYAPDGRRLYRDFLVNKYGSSEEAKAAAVEANNASMTEFRARKLRDESRRMIERSRGQIDDNEATAPLALFLPPPEADSKVWRYMDFTKLISMFEQKGVFLSRADKLNDPFEGSFTKVNQELRPLVRKYLRLTGGLSAAEIVQKLREWVGASCWHVNAHESAGMWKLYARSEEAVCIQTTYDRLCSIVPPDARIGMVRYVDYRNQWIPESNPLAPFMFKRLSFQHEQELRILKPIGDLNALQSLVDIPHNKAEGELISCDLTQIIEAVHVAPDAPAWFEQLVRSVVFRYWGTAIPVKRSGLADSPLW